MSVGGRPDADGVDHRAKHPVGGARRLGKTVLMVCLIAVAALSCAPSVPEQVRAVGVAAYSPVPSDALPIRRADANALARLREAVRGLRYARADGTFTLAPAAFSGLLPAEPSIESRDVVRLGEVRLFWVGATTDSAQTFDDEQRELLRRAERVRVSVEVELPEEEGEEGVAPLPPEAVAGTFVDEVRAAFHRGVRQGLEELYEGRSVPAHGRVFLLALEPELTVDDVPLPKDPAPLGLRREEYRYRLGEGLKSPDPRRLTIHLALWVLPDVPLD